MDNYNFEEGKSAKFNAGILQTERINEILRTLNFCKSNPTAFNMDLNDWNFNIQLRCIFNLYDEVEGYMDKDERDLCLEIMKKIEEMIDNYPILEERRKYNKVVDRSPNTTNWKIIKKAIDTFERIVKRYGIKHQILSATIDADLEGL